MNRPARNQLCHCGSGKKYKKCCMYKDQEPIPREVMEHFEKVRERQEYLKSIGIHINYVKPIIHLGKKVFALGSTVYAGADTNETFHTFILNMLKKELGHDWLAEQDSLPENEKHFIVTCFNKLADWIERNKGVEANRVSENVWGAKPDGYGKSLLSLAWDICSLIHTHRLPKELVDRLKTKDHYQGARYEIAIAAVFARLNCEIKWTEENSNKRCEFVATHRETNSSLAVEVKSKKRKGVIHENGVMQSIENFFGVRTIRNLFSEALQQNPKDIPFAVFIDINAPLTPEIPLNDKPWVKDAKYLVQKKLKNLSPEEYPLSAAFFTNFSYHYQTESEADQGEMCGIIIPHSKFPPPSPQFFSYLEGALTHHGVVPAIDLD